MPLTMFWCRFYSCVVVYVLLRGKWQIVVSSNQRKYNREKLLVNSIIHLTVIFPSRALCTTERKFSGTGLN